MNDGHLLYLYSISNKERNYTGNKFIFHCVIEQKEDNKIGVERKKERKKDKKNLNLNCISNLRCKDVANSKKN